MAVRRIAGRGPGSRSSGQPGDAFERGPLSRWHFTGCHVLSPALLDLVPEQPFDCDVNRHLYPGLLDGRVRGHLDAGAWCDLGSPAGYLAAHQELLAGRFASGRFPGADPFLGLAEGVPGVWTAEDLEVEPGAELRAPLLLCAGSRVEAGARVGPGVSVGRACRIGAGAVVEEAVLWDGTAVAAGERLSRVIAAGELRVEAGPAGGER